jgi:hypothetical protein
MGWDREGDICLIKNNISREDDVVVGEIETLVAIMISGVSEENIFGGLRCQFVSGFGREIGIVDATEHAQVLIGGGDSIQGKVWTGHADRLGGEAVHKYVMVSRPCAQQRARIEAWKSRERSILLMVRMMHSSLSFCGDVYGQDIRKITQLVVKNVWEEALSNSWPLYHWTDLMVQPNYVET